MTALLVSPRTNGQRPTFGIDPGALTANAASYLSGFRSANELQNCTAKAAEASDRRLHAKGFQLEDQPAH